MKLYKRWKGLLKRNSYVKYQSPGIHHLKVMTKVIIADQMTQKTGSPALGDLRSRGQLKKIIERFQIKHILRNNFQISNITNQFHKEL
jgi:hypothetical protein